MTALEFPVWGKAGCCIQRLLVWCPQGWTCPLKVSSPWGLAKPAAPAQGVAPGQSQGHPVPASWGLRLPEDCIWPTKAPVHSALTPGPEAVTALHEDGCQMQNPEKIKFQESVKNHLMPGVPLTCLGYCHASLHPCPLWTGLGSVYTTLQAF